MEKIYKDKNAPVEERVKSLLGEMTTEEKLDQIVLRGCNDLDKLLEQIERGERVCVPSTYCTNRVDPEKFNRLQKYVLEHERLGIPCLFAGEGLHGVCSPYATVFPTSGCVAATFDEDLMYAEADVIGEEAHNLGFRQLYSPHLDIARDPRWGRTEESFGEDPFLLARMGINYIKALQKHNVAATVKHYLCYGFGEGGLNLAPAHIGEREAREIMLKPFADCIAEARPWALMASYNEIDGIPVHASKLWMNKVLRGELGYDGMVISDYGALNMFGRFHRICESRLEAGKIAAECGIDMEACGAYAYGEDFRNAVLAGEIPIDLIDKMVANILRLKFRTGIFENPYIDVGKFREVHKEPSIALSRKIAERGIVLLKNDGILPLKGVRKIALSGPNCDLAQLGNYMFYRKVGDSLPCVADGVKTLKSTLEEVFGQENVYTAKGADFVFYDEEELRMAVKAAEQSDVVVLALGDNSRGIFGGNQVPAGENGERFSAVTSGEGFDMNTVELTAAQKTLVKAIAETGKPVVMLLYGGRPHAVTEELPLCSAVLQVFGPGEGGNEALVDILTGKVVPSGRLPISFPRSTGHIPCFYNCKPSARGTLYRRPGSAEKPGMDYVLDSPDALFPFGFGLSYTRFDYSDLCVKMEKDGSATVTVRVKNVGDFDAEVSVLTYISACYRIVTPEVKKLAAFKRIALKKGEGKSVKMDIPRAAFSYVDEDMRTVYHYGKFTVTCENLSVIADTSESE